jgi:hypothetical protein
MSNPWLHQLAILLAIGTLLLIIDVSMVGPATQPESFAWILSSGGSIVSKVLSLSSLCSRNVSCGETGASP